MRSTNEICTLKKRMVKGRYYFLIEDINKDCIFNRRNPNGSLYSGMFLNSYSEKEGKLLTKEGIKKIYFYGKFFWTFDKEERDQYSKEHHNKPNK